MGRSSRRETVEQSERGSSADSSGRGSSSRRMRRSRKRKSTVKAFRDGVRAPKVVEKPSDKNASAVMSFSRRGGTVGDVVRVSLSLVKARVPIWVKSNYSSGTLNVVLNITQAAWTTLREFFRGPPTPELLAPTTDPAAAPGWLELAQVFKVEQDILALSEWLASSYSSASSWPQANAAAWAYLLANNNQPKALGWFRSSHSPPTGLSSSSSSSSSFSSSLAATASSSSSKKYRLSDRALATVAAGIAAGFRAPGVQAALPRFDTDLFLSVLRTDTLETGGSASGEDEVIAAVGKWISEDRKHRTKLVKKSALLDGFCVRFSHASSSCLMSLISNRLWLSPKDDGYETLVVTVMSAMASKTSGGPPGNVPRVTRRKGPPAAAPSLRVTTRRGKTSSSGYLSCASDDSSDDDEEDEPAICASAPPAPPSSSRRR